MTSELIDLVYTTERTERGGRASTTAASVVWKCFFDIAAKTGSIPYYSLESNNIDVDLDIT